MDRDDREEGPERIERLPGEIESGMYTGSDEGEPAPATEELGHVPDREEALRVFERIDDEIEGNAQGRERKR